MSASESVDIVFGASSGIAQALLKRWVAQSIRPVVAVSRGAPGWPSDSEAIEWLSCDYSEPGLSLVSAHLVARRADVARLVICNGVLQGTDYRPERALSQINALALESVFEINTFLPMRILAALAPLLKASAKPKIVVLSARVGSIGDNRLGGWYSYRGSKAALNMMLKCAALELRRLNPQAKLIAYHPGTVDTPLSRPFQNSVKRETLLSPERAAEALDRVIQQAKPDGELAYLDWRGETIPW